MKKRIVQLYDADGERAGLIMTSLEDEVIQKKWNSYNNEDGSTDVDEFVYDIEMENFGTTERVFVDEIYVTK